MHDHPETGILHLNNKTYDLAQLSAEERIRLQHEALHDKHKGHEAMHAEMVLILFVSLIVSQILLVFWKTKHFKSFQIFTMFGMWLIPFIMSIRFAYYRFVCTWLIFSSITTYVFKMATKSPIDRTTPRLLYKWFLLVHKVTYIMGIGGYVGLMLTFLGFNFLLFISPNASLDLSMLLMFYGIYYGVLARDIAEICSDMMAARIGYYTETGIPKRALETNMCSICANEIMILDNEQTLFEESHKLPCGHLFHEFCIRGWCIVGKKQTCPYCKEKVDLKQLFPNPWEKPHILYGNLLDWIRYLIAWQPVIVIMVQGINWSMGLE